MSGDSRILRLLILLHLGVCGQCLNSRITLETASTSPNSRIRNYECDHIDLQEETFVGCICLQGVWALEVVKENVGWQSVTYEWKTFAAKTKHCFRFAQWVRRITKVGSNPEERKVVRLGKRKTNTFLVMNDQNWEVGSKDGKTKFCLPGTPQGAYCVYKVARRIKMGQNSSSTCSQNARVLSAEKCVMFDEVKDSDVGPFQCDLVVGNSDPLQMVDGTEEPRGAPARRKREDTPAGAAEGEKKPWNFTTVDEEYLDDEEKANYMGDPAMMAALQEEVVRAVIDLQDLENMQSHRKKRGMVQSRFELPAIRMIRTTIKSFQILCPYVKIELVQLALDTLLRLQKFYLHLRETQITWATFIRVMRSLETCQSKVETYQFFQNMTLRYENESVAECGKTEPPSTSVHAYNPTMIDYMGMKFESQLSPCNIPDKSQCRQGPKGLWLPANNFTKMTHTLEVPRHATSDPTRHEPITEIVWKAFAIIQSRCYSHFQIYFNDIHHYTTSILPFFTNQIQYIWLFNGTNMSFGANSSGYMNYSDNPYIWYGNFFGNVSEIYRDMDNCYSVTKGAYDQYGYWINRPPIDFTNQWFRRKRETDFTAPADSKQCRVYNADEEDYATSDLAEE